MVITKYYNDLGKSFMWICAFIALGYRITELCELLFAFPKPWLFPFVTVLPTSHFAVLYLPPWNGFGGTVNQLIRTEPPPPRGELVIQVLSIRCPLPGIWFFGRGTVRLKGEGTHSSLSFYFLPSLSITELYSYFNFFFKYWVILNLSNKSSDFSFPYTGEW